MRGKGTSIEVWFSMVITLVLFFIVTGFVITGCEKEKQEISRAPNPTPTPCAAIDPTPFRNQGAHTRLGTYEVCVTAGKCAATQVDTENKIAQAYCTSTQSATCRPGDCGLTSRSCKPVFDVQNSPQLYIRGCSVTAVGPPSCNAGEELCKCTLYIPPRKELDCDCGCS